MTELRERQAGVRFQSAASEGGRFCHDFARLCVFVAGAAAREGGSVYAGGGVLRVTVSSEPPEQECSRIRVRCRVRGGSLYMLLSFRSAWDAKLGSVLQAISFDLHLGESV